ncbi:FK506-binding protein 1 [Porphyridium purpureum]|uniref:peptidylprolyl isomerase n=1 Tax=Porphyridium purpureum TaxID=35688 RepID=A0A5J4YPS2_PORPP|nr:FK506-binding protein 1 [Porphyridium purpureum]|eukprot:POR1533..scf295_9
MAFIPSARRRGKAREAWCDAPCECARDCGSEAAGAVDVAASPRRVMLNGAAAAAIAAGLGFDRRGLPVRGLPQLRRRPPPRPWPTVTGDAVWPAVQGAQDGGCASRVGDLVGIRFRASFNGNDTFRTEEPFFIRVGSNSVIKGIEEALLMMRSGDRLALIVPGDLGFGPKARRAMPGKPGLPPNATLEYELELAEFPGYEAKELVQDE